MAGLPVGEDDALVSDDIAEGYGDGRCTDAKHLRRARHVVHDGMDDKAR